MALSENLSSNVPAETILHFTHELSRTKRKLDEASAAHRQMVKRAKGEGVPSEAILESIAWSRMDPADRLKRLSDRIRVETVRYPDSAEDLTDLLAHLDIEVSDKMRFTDVVFDAEQRGYQAGRFAVPVEDNPYQPGTEMHQTWRNFWGQGQAANALSLGDGAKAASTERRKPGRKEAAPELPGVPPASKKAAKKAVAKRKSPAKQANGDAALDANAVH